MKHLRGAAGIILVPYLCPCASCALLHLRLPACTRAWMSAAGRAILISRQSGLPVSRVVYIRAGVGLEYVDPYFQSNYEKPWMQA